MACELAPGPFSCSLEASRKQCLRQSPTDKGAFVEVLVSREVPANRWRKELRCIRVGKNNAYLYPHPSPMAAQLRTKRDFSLPIISPVGKRESM